MIVSESKLTNLNMAFNPKRTHLIDFDSDGDLDLYINDNSSELWSHVLICESRQTMSLSST